MIKLFPLTTSSDVIFVNSFLLTFLPLLPSVVHCQPNVLAEYKVPLEKLGKFVHTLVEPLDIMCKEAAIVINRNSSNRKKDITKILCGKVHELQWKIAYMSRKLRDEGETHAEDIDGLISLTFSDVKDEVASKLLEHLMEYYSGKSKREILFEMEEVLGQVLPGGTQVPGRYDLLKQELKNKVDELKLLQFQGDFTSEQAKKLAYECVYESRAMAKLFTRRQEPIGEFHWALQQFPVDLLVYKMEIPELRDIRIEWDEHQDGIIGAEGLVPEGYEEAKWLLDKFNDRLLKPLGQKCVEIKWSRNLELMESWFCTMIQSLEDYSIKELKEKLEELEPKSKSNSKALTESAYKSNTGKMLFKRIAVLGQSFLAITSETRKQENYYLLKELRTKLQISSSTITSTDVISSTDHHLSDERIELGARKKMFREHFEEIFKHFVQLHSSGDFISPMVIQAALDCVKFHNRYETKKFFQSPVEQLLWALQQFTLDFMAYSLVVPWIREFPIHHINSLIERTKAAQLLNRFNGQILAKLEAKCQKIGHKPGLEQNLCRSVSGMLKAVEQKEMKRNLLLGDEIENVGRIIADIKEHIYLQDVIGLWTWLSKQIPEEESKKIKEEVDKMNKNDSFGSTNELKLRFEEKLIKLREMIFYEKDFSSMRVNEVALDCLYTGHRMTFGCEDGNRNSNQKNSFDELATMLHQFSVNLLVYGMEIAEIRQIFPDIIMWTHGMDY